MVGNLTLNAEQRDRAFDHYTLSVPFPIAFGRVGALGPVVFSLDSIKVGLSDATPTLYPNFQLRTSCPSWNYKRNNNFSSQKIAVFVCFFFCVLNLQSRDLGSPKFCKTCCFI